MGGLACWLLSVGPLHANAQTTPRDLRGAAQAAEGTGAIGGIVVSGESSARPLRLAHVVLIGTATGTLRVTSTDGDGRFAFVNLPADRYTIGASRPPYLGAVAGAKRPGRPGTPIALADGQTMANVSISLPPGAAITGVITDERGQPGAGVVVGLQQWRQQGGERVLTTVPLGMIATDDRGRYRIYGLLPGEYVVLAMRFAGVPGGRTLTDVEVDAALKGAPVAAAAGRSSARDAPVFFPGTTRASDAIPVALAVGEERQGVDFRLELVSTARVEGAVASGDRQPPASVMLMLTTASPNAALQNSGFARASTDGRFAFPNVPPGSYTLTATGSGAQAGHFATTPVELTGVDQLGIQLTLRPPLTLSARIAFEGTTPPPALAGHRIPLRSLTPGLTGTAAPQVGVTNATGVFTITRVSPGRYVLGGPLFFGASADSVTWSLQSVVIDSRDVIDLPFDVTAEALPKDIVVTYGDRSQEISGRLLHGSGAAATDYTVVAFPADKAYWIPGSRRILTSRPGTDGRFAFGGPGPVSLPAGDYLLAAVTDIDRDEQYDPAFLAALVASAVRVTLQPGERKVQDLEVR